MCMCVRACVCVHMYVRDRERGTDQSKETGKAFCFVFLMSFSPCLMNKGFFPCYFALGFTNAVASCVDSVKDKLLGSWVIYFCCLLNPRSIWVWVFDTRVHWKWSVKYAVMLPGWVVFEPPEVRWHVSPILQCLHSKYSHQWLWFSTWSLICKLQP